MSLRFIYLRQGRRRKEQVRLESHRADTDRFPSGLIEAALARLFPLVFL